nr:hypothetical protein GCM10020093_004830 [Planobispora longispora]
MSSTPKAPESSSPPLSLTLIRLLRAKMLFLIVLWAPVTCTPLTLRSACTASSSLRSPRTSKPAHRQPLARIPVTRTWEPVITTQFPPLPVIFGDTPSPYVATVMGAPGRPGPSA